MDKKQAQRLIDNGYTHEVIWAYAGYCHEQGAHVSNHKNYEAAAQKAAQSTMWRVLDLRHYISPEGW